MEEVKRNITTVLEILEIGRTDSVAHWDESNFKRAQQWALYAEEVYKKLKSKASLAQVLFKHINQNQKFNKDNMTQDLLFSNLKCATEKLRTILLQNPHLSSSQFSFVLDMYEVDFLTLSNNNLDGLISDSFHISCTKGVFLALSSIRNKLSNKLEESSHFDGCIDQYLLPGLLEKSKPQTSEVCLDVCGKLLWMNLQKMHAVQKVDPESSKHFIIKWLKQFLCQEKGMEVLLRMLIVPMKSEECSMSLNSNDVELLDPVKRLVLCWILDSSLDGNKADYHEKLWSCPSPLLCYVSFTYIPFCKSYLNFLKSLGESLLGRPSMVSSQDATSYECVYQDVIQRFQELLKGPRHISELCKQIIRSWFLSNPADPSCSKSHMQNSEMNFWKRIYQQMC